MDIGDLKMGLSKLTADLLLKEYVENQKSTVAIAKITGSYPEQVRRALKKYNIPIRTRSKASQNFYENGGINARKGYKFSEEEKEQASVNSKEYWLSEDSNEARKKIAKASKRYWKTVSKSEKSAIIERLHLACRKASKEGSKAQLTVAAILAEKYDYYVETGVVQIAGIGDLEVDITLPHEGIAIEVDGITHFEEVYSDNRYDRAQEADARKNEKLTNVGWSVIRIQLHCERFSKGSCLISCKELHEMIENKTYNKNDVTILEMH